MSFMLREFQDQTADKLLAAIAAWVQTVAERGRPPTTVDGDVIPLIGHLAAITGAGKTPILARVIGSIGPAVVLWTTNRSVVIEQTVKKLNDTYRHFLPPDSTIIGEEPTPRQWASLLEDETGLFIWCRSVASWNAPNEEGTKGTGQARLNIHRPAADRAGSRAPWELLGDVESRKRPLWVVYDESHGQTDVQLDQLLDLNPIGILAASATPSFSEQIDRFEKSLADSAVFGPIAKAAMVEVATRDVAAAGLLKTTIEMDDLNTDDGSRVQAAVTKLAELTRLANDNGIHVSPRAVLVVEESDRSDGDPRPKVLWETLTERCGVPASAIAVATSTRELPKNAERVTSLAQLRDRHRFLIFNKKFQEGWDDPEAYIAYFDGETKSTRRIKQILGRILRQPNQRPFDGLPDLNTAFVFVSSPDDKFAAIVDGIRKHLVDEYGSDENGKPNVTTRTRSERPGMIPLRPEAAGLELPVSALRVSSLEDVYARVASFGQRPFPLADLEAPGSVTRSRFQLTDIEKKITTQIVAIGRHIRSGNRAFFLDRVRALSRRAFDALPDHLVGGPAFNQDSATFSQAQNEIRVLAEAYVLTFEERVSYTREPDPHRSTWRPTALEPTQPATLAFARSLHRAYPEGRSFLNKDETPMAHALDAAGEGWWMRNPPTASQGGFGIPMPVKVLSSETFYPDFLWWVDGTCFAIDTTGLQILPGKVRGKLLDITQPKIGLVVRGKVLESLDRADEGGWTLMLPGPTGSPRRLLYHDLGPLLAELRANR